jgi:hypothetical protein
MAHSFERWTGGNYRAAGKSGVCRNQPEVPVCGDGGDGMMAMIETPRKASKRTHDLPADLGTPNSSHSLSAVSPLIN